MKTNHLTYPAYQKSYKGIRYMLVNMKCSSKPAWYMKFDSFNIASEREQTTFYSTKKQCDELAKYLIDKAINAFILRQSD